MEKCLSSGIITKTTKASTLVFAGHCELIAVHGVATGASVVTITDAKTAVETGTVVFYDHQAADHGQIDFAPGKGIDCLLGISATVTNGDIIVYYRPLA